MRQAARVKQAGGEPAVVLELAERRVFHYAPLAKLPPERLVPQTFLGCGDAWLLSNDIEQALRVRRDGLKVFGQSTVLVEFHGRVAEACLEQGRLKEAEEAIDAINSILQKVGASVTREQKLALTGPTSSDRPGAGSKRANSQRRLPLLSQVVTSQTSGSRDISGTVNALWLMGTAYASQGEWRLAAMAHDEAIKLQPNLPALRLAAASAWPSSPAGAGQRAGRGGAEPGRVAGGLAVTGRFAIANSKLPTQATAKLATV